MDAPKGADHSVDGDAVITAEETTVVDQDAFVKPVLVPNDSRTDFIPSVGDPSLLPAQGVRIHVAESLQKQAFFSKSEKRTVEHASGSEQSERRVLSKLTEHPLVSSGLEGDSSRLFQRVLFKDDLANIGVFDNAQDSALLAASEQFASVVIEVFSGSSGLTKAFIEHGCEGIAVDWLRNSSIPLVPVILIDLSEPWGEELLYKAIKSQRVRYVHFAPPCGTASRAREIPVPLHLRGTTWKVPGPLRSDVMPDGLHNLDDVEELRVCKANKHYAVTAKAILLADKLGIHWSCENPTNSLFWKTTPIVSMRRVLDERCRESGKQAPIFATFQNCAFGGERPKWSSWLTDVQGFQAMQDSGECTGDHKHKPWGLGADGFNTAGEAAYPKQLCATAASIVVNTLVNEGKFTAAIKPALEINPTHTGLQGAEAGKQARGQKAPRLIPEYAAVRKFQVLADCASPLFDGQIIEKGLDVVNDFIPPGSKIMRTQPENGGRRTVYAAVPRTVETFLEKAKSVKHPIDSFTNLEADIYSNIFWTLTEGADAVIKFREDQINKLISVEASSKVSEQHIHNKLPEEFRRPLESKNFLVHKFLFRQIKHKDDKLLGRLTAGFQMSGTLENSNVFDSCVPRNPNPVPIKQLLKSTKWVRHSIAAKLGPSGDKKLDETIEEITQKELEAVRSNSMLDTVGVGWLHEGLGYGKEVRLDPSTTLASTDITPQCLLTREYRWVQWTEFSPL